MNNCFSRQCLGIAAALLFAANAFALNVTINPGSYIGDWRVNNQTGYNTGAVTVDLAEGSYQMVIGTAAQFTFAVANDGSVTSSNPAAATGGLNTLTFNTTTIHIDPAMFDIQDSPEDYASWWVGRVIPPQLAATDVELIKGLTFAVQVGTFGRFTITLDAAGAITVDNGVSGTVSGNTLTFNTMAVDIDPADFLIQSHATNTARWYISRVIREKTIAATVNLVPGIRYGAGAGTYGTFYFNVDASGVVSVENGVSATGGAQILTFNTTTINIDPGDFIEQVDGGGAARWFVSRVISEANGAGSVTVVPGVRYGVGVGTYGLFYIDVDGNGDIQVVNNVSATASGNSLVFNTENVLIDPAGFTDNWRISRVVSTTGPQLVKLVPDAIRYQLFADSEVHDFDVATPCAVTPAEITLSGNTFTLSCGLPDIDADGIPDDTDNCPFVSNEDQLDLDGDGQGDVCDSDDDGDGVGDDIDNCPAFANFDQSDLDGDGIGDVCDEDTDGDSVADGADNCPLIANTDQANSDDDTAGDACDVDDDNDGVDDGVDNCPLVANPDQDDFNGDGNGDACDADVDGDGVANAADQCPASAPGQPVNSQGCTGAQYLALTCLADDFRNHGQYVSCVAHAANQLVRDGLLDPKQKSAFVKAAAQSN